MGAISKITQPSLFVSKAKYLKITLIQVYAPTSNVEKLKLNGSMKACKTF